MYCLYGETKKPTPDMLKNIDVLVFDVQDVETRFYTYIYTMAYTMKASKENHIPFIVLYRPNPLGGTKVEGLVLNPKYSSFVGMYPIALLHGMTVGELAEYFNQECQKESDLIIENRKLPGMAASFLAEWIFKSKKLFKYSIAWVTTFFWEPFLHNYPSARTLLPITLIL